MSESTKVILAGGGLLLVWHLFLRPRPVITSATVPPPANPYGAIAGYAPMPNYPPNPGDTNNWAGALAAGLTSLGQVGVAAINARSGPSQSTGQYNQDLGYGGGGAQYNSDPYYSDPDYY